MRRQSNPILGNSEPIQKVVGKRRSENSNAALTSPAPASPETPQKFSIRTFPKASSASTHSRIFESTPVSPPPSRFRRESATTSASGTPAAGVASTTPTTTGRKRVQQQTRTIAEPSTPPKTPTPKPAQQAPLKSRHFDQTTPKEPTATPRPHLKPQPESNAHQWKSSILLGDDSPATPSFGPTKISYLPKRRTALQKEAQGSVKLAELTGFQDVAVLRYKKEAGKLDPASVGVAAGKSVPRNVEG
ncbi:hypothetical protein HDU81_000878 [Chytriomyces hyalinus]|nr:hypothetical protein HDU81_000878 [Chytriomyces hyalinus]